MSESPAPASSPFDFSALRRHPDVEGDNLHAVDATDRLILDEAASTLDALSGEHVVVIGDHYGALTLGAIAAHNLTGVRVFQDSLIGERALAENAERTGHTDAFTSLPLGAELLAEAKLVLVQLPRQIAALDEISRLIAIHADPEVLVVSGGRIKHLSPAMNTILGESFTEVRASLARQKSRLLIASGPRAVEARVPARAEIPELELTVCSGSQTFAGASLDIGTRELLKFLPKYARWAKVAVDLGSGTGIVASAVAKARPDIQVIATDISADAVAASQATAEANGVADRVEARRDIGLSQQPDASVDLVLLNPPFHTGATVHAGLAEALFREAARVLRPGGELWTVYNTHLGYRGALGRIVGPTNQRLRTTKFTVTLSVKAEAPAS
ncbi:16S rRNA (guanine1207-N2)-methyltransferase [Mycetocola sp. BIGb0189]|uniref:methyltransferase n=1 Tax=Mycetocola sp. BIGb0189 TaxID=2940604 RepID=UPI00216892BD|nr:methyltransferase [Mycetocola sp. BIGb0189]MCS4277217.1 16S rRNA (guanine1207-N2)-methyltransferase [Mycetocola sp. BIGb0189]